MILRARRHIWLFGFCLSALACAESDVTASTDGAVECVDTVDPAEGFLPCDVEAVLVAKCQRCHDTLEALQPCLADDSCAAGPFPLLTFSDTRRVDTRRVIGERAVYERMGSAVESGFMPFQLRSIQPPVEPLTEDEKRVLLDWIADCAPSAAAACAP